MCVHKRYIAEHFAVRAVIGGDCWYFFGIEMDANFVDSDCLTFDMSSFFLVLLSGIGQFARPIGVAGDGTRYLQIMSDFISRTPWSWSLLMDLMSIVGGKLKRFDVCDSAVDACTGACREKVWLCGGCYR